MKEMLWALEENVELGIQCYYGIITKSKQRQIPGIQG